MQHTEGNMSAESIARPFARVVATEFSIGVVEDVVAKGCFLSSGTNPDVWRDSMDDGT